MKIYELIINYVNKYADRSVSKGDLIFEVIQWFDSYIFINLCVF